MTSIKHLCSYFALVFLSLHPFYMLADEEDFCEFFEEETSNFGWELKLDFIEWKPCASDLEYAAKHTTSNPNIFKIHAIRPKWEPGLRVSVIFPEIYHSWDFIAAYILITPQSDAKIHSDGNILTVLSFPPLSESEFADTAKAKWDAGYHEWKTLLGYDILRNECYAIKTLFGLTGIALNQNLKSSIIKDLDVSRTKWKSHFCGTGFQIGIQSAYRLSENFEFLVQANGSILVGNAATKHKEANEVFKERMRSQIVQGYQIGTGILYETSLLNIDTLLRIGYEFLEWQNIPTHRTFISGNAPALSSSGRGRSFGFHGINLGATMKF